MIKQNGVYSIICDHCQETLTTAHEGWSFFVDEEAAHEAADSEGWYHENGHDQYYCKDCHWIDDNDELRLRIERWKEVSPATISDTQGGLRWVKAIDKLPENNELKNIGARISGDIEALRFFNDKFHIYTKVGWLPIVSAIDTVFWLEESPQPKEPGEDKPESPESFQNWLDNNCDPHKEPGDKNDAHDNPILDRQDHIGDFTDMVRKPGDKALPVEEAPNKCGSHPDIPQEDMRKIEIACSTWKDDITPWMFKGMVRGYLLAIRKLPAYITRSPEETDNLVTLFEELSTLRTQLDQSRHDTAVYKEWYEKGQKVIAALTEELSTYREFIEWNEASMDNDEWTLNAMSDKMESILKKYPTKQ